MLWKSLYKLYERIIWSKKDQYHVWAHVFKSIISLHLPVCLQAYICNWRSFWGNHEYSIRSCETLYWLFPESGHSNRLKIFIRWLLVHINSFLNFSAKIAFRKKFLMKNRAVFGGFNIHFRRLWNFFFHVGCFATELVTDSTIARLFTFAVDTVVNELGAKRIQLIAS